VQNAATTNRRARARVLLLSCCALATTASACDSGRNEETGPALCEAGTLFLSGYFDGTYVNQRIRHTSFVVQQQSSPHTLDVAYATGAFHLEWAAALSVDGPSVNATGRIVVPGGSLMGSTFCSAEVPLSLDPKTDASSRFVEYEFNLGALSLGPDCPGRSVPGSVLGCLRE